MKLRPGRASVESRLVGGSAKDQGTRATSIALFIVGAAGAAFLLRRQIAAPLVVATILFAVALPALVAGSHQD